MPKRCGYLGEDELNKGWGGGIDGSVEEQLDQFKSDYFDFNCSLFRFYDTCVPIIHGDIKPDNIVLSKMGYEGEDGQKLVARLIDWTPLFYGTT